MRKFKWAMSILLIGSLIGLIGCSKDTTKEKALEKKVANLEQQISNNKQEKETVIGKEEPKPIVVKVVDPNTKQTIKSFIPKDMGYGAGSEDYKAEVEEWAKNLARGTGKTNGYDQRMIPDKIDANGQVIKGKPRVILDEKILSERVFNAMANGGTVELPLSVTESGYKSEDAPNLGEVVVAAFTTYFNSSVTGRNKNIELSANAINNVIVGVDDIFSFNTTVGPSDAVHGYQKAKEAVNGKLVDGIGGGICQTSSTLFNAVDKIGVTYVEKHHHSVHVGYVPTGRDATVSYGGLDFRFQNTTSVPLLLRAYTNKNLLTVEVRTAKKYQGSIKMIR